ncbi:hypothetical protein ZWY2020_049542 [Hordeum vulgare]|nr:hypothetical protein ZWY2020_049542 [Hordeum vulgare]
MGRADGAADRRRVIGHGSVDDDGKPKRTGTVWTASAHIITAVIGSGVLSLPWSVAQLGWIAGSLTLFLFAAVTYYTSSLLADCYRSDDAVAGKRNYTYMEAVESYLGSRQVWFCGLCQYVNLVELQSGTPLQHRSVPRPTGKTTMGGTEIGIDVTNSAQKIWLTLQALGNIAFAYHTHGSHRNPGMHDTVKAPPAENKTMRKANLLGVSTTTAFYMLCGCLGYAAFGNAAPGNMLTGFGFYEPFWLIDFANICIVVHLIGAYQVYCQPIYAAVESWAAARWAQTSSSAGTIPSPPASSASTCSSCFWPLTVYFPVEMYKRQSKVERFSKKWVVLQSLSFMCFAVTVAVTVASVQGITQSLKNYVPFKTKL